MFRDQHVILIVNKQGTFSCLQSAKSQGNPDTVKIYCPAIQDLYTEKNSNVQDTNRIAASPLPNGKNFGNISD